MSAILNALRRVQEKRRHVRSARLTSASAEGRHHTTGPSFREPPFDDTADPRFFYANPSHDEAITSLLYGIYERKGFITLIGEAGTGKTTVLRKVMTELSLPICTAFFNTTTLTFDELLDCLCDDFDLSVKGVRRLDKIRALGSFLTARLEAGGTGVLVIDEAHHLAVEVLENLRLLSNLERGNHKLFQIVLAGQPELERKLGLRELRQLKQRIAIRCWLDRLTAPNVGPFIQHRLRIAGGETQELFTPEAVRRIADYSQGVPRLINTLCDNALHRIGRATDQTISAAIIEEVAHILRLKRARRGKMQGVFTRCRFLLQQRPRQLAWVGAGVLLIALAAEVYKMQLPPHSAPSGQNQNATTHLSTAPDSSLPVREKPVVRSEEGRLERVESAAAHQTGTELERPEPAQQLLSLSAQVAARKSLGDPPGEDQRRAAPAENSRTGEGEGQFITVAQGDFISSIVLKMYGTYSALAFDLIKTFNPQVTDLNRISPGDRLWLPSLTRDTLMRKQADGSYQIIVGSFLSAQRAQEVSKIIKREGYTVVTTPRGVSRTLVVYRVEIVGLTTTETVDRAWKWVSTMSPLG